MREAQADLSTGHARELAKKRQDAAERFDAAVAAMQAAYTEHQALGADILALSHARLGLTSGNALEAVLAIRGDRRIEAAMPEMVAAVHPSVQRSERRMPLAVSERSVWARFLGTRA